VIVVVYMCYAMCVVWCVYGFVCVVMSVCVVGMMCVFGYGVVFVVV